MKAPGHRNIGQGWLTILDNDKPRYICPATDTALESPCSVHGCVLWVHNEKVNNCVGAFAAIKAAHAEERLKVKPSVVKDGNSSLKQAAHGKMTFHDLGYAYGLTRPRVEGHVALGREIFNILSPLFVEGGARTSASATERTGSPANFTHTAPVQHTVNGETYRVCPCCESVIGPEDEDLVFAYIEKYEIVWCSRECAMELPLDGYLVSHRYKRHWSEIALGIGAIDERSRVREITPERLDALRQAALHQGYVPPADGSAKID